MGQQQSIPNLIFRVKSNCCSNVEKDEEDGNMVSTRGTGRVHRCLETGEKGKETDSANIRMVEKSTRVQFEQTDET